MTMTTQIVTALELTSERPERVRSIIELIMADTVSTYLEYEEYAHLHDLFIRSGEDIVENYKSVTASILLFDEYRQLLPLVDQLVNNIGADLFTDMWDADESSALSEILRCFGHGVSFWDNWKYQDFGFNDMPELRELLILPLDVATQILDKVAEREILINDMLEDGSFDIWLAENYEHSGGEYYLSKNPNDYLMYELHTLREQWEEDNNIQETEEDEEEDNKFIPDADRFDYLVDEEEVEPDNVTTFKIPSHYLSLIFNGDASGYEDEDIKAWEEFEQQMIADGFTNGYWITPDDTESYFSWSNDVHNLGADVTDLQWVDVS